jgi:hypothetical protein
LLTIVFAGKEATVFHHAFSFRDRRYLFQKIGEFNFHMSRLCAELLAHLFQNRLKSFDINLTAEVIEYFHKPAHMRALKMMRQVDIHIDGGIYRLSAANAVQHNDRVFDVFHSDLFNINIARIFLVLNINHIKQIPWCSGSCLCASHAVQQGFTTFYSSL